MSTIAKFMLMIVEVLITVLLITIILMNVYQNKMSYASIKEQDDRMSYVEKQPYEYNEGDPRKDKYDFEDDRYNH